MTWTRRSNRDYQARRRADMRARGLCQRCGRPAAVRNDKRMSRCETCLPLIGGTRYVPLDDLLERTSIRILRTLSRFDGIAATDLLDALDVFDERRLTTGSRLVQLAKHGLAEWRDRLYRITPAGREWLAKQLRRADPGVATDKEAA